MYIDDKILEGLLSLIFDLRKEIASLRENLLTKIDIAEMVAARKAMLEEPDDDD